MRSYAIPGVESVNVDIPTKQVTVRRDPANVDLDRLREAPAAEDYPVASMA